MYQIIDFAKVRFYLLVLTITVSLHNIRCLKLYCQCFALSTTCGPKCKCQTCQNTTLHAEAIEEARKVILERNPSAFDDKFRGSPTPYRPAYSPPTTVTWGAPTYPGAAGAQVVAPSIPTAPPPRVNKYGCKCRRSFCLKKVSKCDWVRSHCLFTFWFRFDLI